MADIKGTPGGLPGQTSRRYHDETDGTYSESQASHLRYWDTGTLAWERVSGTSGAISTSSGGGGGAATVADGADVAEGTTTDASSANTVIGLLKNIKAALAGSLTVNAHNVTNAGTFAVQSAATLAAETTKVIGTVNQGTSPWVVGSHAVTNAGTFAVQGKLIDTGGVNAAAVSAAGRLSVDASGVAVPVTDNAGSLTVDAPVGTPAFVRLSDGAAAITALPVTDNAGSLTVDAPVGTPVFVRLSDGAATLIGQKAMTASLPVVLASDQASVPVAATQSGTWTVQPGNTPNTSPWLASIHDGTTKVKVTVVNAQPASSDGALLVNSLRTAAGTVLASASRGVATVNTDLVNYNGKGIRVWQDLTILGASSVCQFSIQEKDPVSGKFITLLASAATGAGVNSTGTYKLTLYPGLTAVANVTGSDVVPMNIRIVSTVTTAASTFSIGYALIP